MEIQYADIDIIYNKSLGYCNIHEIFGCNDDCKKYKSYSSYCLVHKFENCSCIYRKYVCENYLLTDATEKFMSNFLPIEELKKDKICCRCGDCGATIYSVENNISIQWKHIACPKYCKYGQKILE